MKKFLKLCKKVCQNFWVQLIFLVGCSVAIFALGGAFASGQNIWDAILAMITSTDVLSIFLAAVVSVIVAKLVIRTNRVLEESLKIEDDHHKIIDKYCDHAKDEVDLSTDLFRKEGEYMYLKRVPEKRRCPKNMASDPYSPGYSRRRREIEQYYREGKLFLSSICIYANVLGDARVVMRDRPEMAELPTFLLNNAVDLLEAHGTSNVRNNVTIRLRDVFYDGETLTLETERSQYFFMLITNRCMDYKLGNGLSVREVYEYNSTVSPLSDSKLGNQIGINGLIFTRDGYLLLEKRGKKKATWKDKFAQPISLAMKEKDLGLNGGVLGAAPECAEEAFKKIILKTVLKNYGLTERDLVPFSMAHNFFGIARDLLEGGKPNLYFYVVADMTAAEFKIFMEKKARMAAEARADVAKVRQYGLPVLSRDKLDSDFFLVDHRKITIDFGYRLRLKARDMMHVKRQYYPCVNRVLHVFDGFGHRLRQRFGLSVRKECGEALLACLYYADVCHERMLRAAERRAGEEQYHEG